MGKSKGKSVDTWVIVTVVLLIGGLLFAVSPVGRNLIKAAIYGDDDNGDDDLPAGSQIVNRKLELTFHDLYAGTDNDGTVTIYLDDGKTLREQGTTTNGVYVSSKYYQSDMVLVLEFENTTTTTERIRNEITVPRMMPADIQAVTNNPITIDAFTCASSITLSIITGKGTAIADASGAGFNKTIEGTTGTIAITWYVPDEDTSFIESYDDIDKMNWYVVLYGKLSGTNYEYIDLNGWDGKYTKGTSVWVFHQIEVTDVTKYKVGATYKYVGSATFSFTVGVTGYSGNGSTLDLWMYGYTDPAYHNDHGSYGPDSFQMDNYGASGFTIQFSD